MSDSPDRSSYKHLSSLAALVLSVAFIGLSFAWPTISTGRSRWTDEQARQYQATSAELHGLSHEFAHHHPQGQADEALADRLHAAEAEFNRLHTQLQAAQRNPVRVAGVLRLAGFVLAAVGAVLHYGPRFQARA